MTISARTNTRTPMRTWLTGMCARRNRGVSPWDRISPEVIHSEAGVQRLIDAQHRRLVDRRQECTNCNPTRPTLLILLCCRFFDTHEARRSEIASLLFPLNLALPSTKKSIIWRINRKAPNVRSRSALAGGVGQGAESRRQGNQHSQDALSLRGSTRAKQTRIETARTAGRDQSANALRGASYADAFAWSLERISAASILIASLHAHAKPTCRYGCVHAPSSWGTGLASKSSRRTRGSSVSPVQPAPRYRKARQRG